MIDINIRNNKPRRGQGIKGVRLLRIWTAAAVLTLGSLAFCASNVQAQPDDADVWEIPADGNPAQLERQAAAAGQGADAGQEAAGENSEARQEETAGESLEAGQEETAGESLEAGQEEAARESLEAGEEGTAEGGLETGLEGTAGESVETEQEGISGQGAAGQEERKQTVFRTGAAQETDTAVPASGDGLEEPVSMYISYGYDNAAKGGRYLPFKAEIVNRQPEPVNGTLQIWSEESDGSIYCYDFQVTAEAGSETKVLEYIPLGTRATQLSVALIDESGQTLLEQQVKLNVSWDVPELFIGILSDTPEKLRYLDGVGVSYGTMRTRTFELQEEDFPSDEIGLSQLDVLVVNDYKLRNLAEEQTAAIMDWVHSGGVLILGTGKRVDDTLGRFAPELLDDSYDAPSLCHINLGEDFPVEEEDAGMLAIPCVDIPLHGGNVIISSNDLALVTVASKEQGLIGVAAFDLGNIASFCERHTSYVDYLFTSLLGESRIARLAEVVYSGNSSQFGAVQSLINTGNVEKLPRLPVYAVIVIVYLLLLGPGLYLFLKSHELQMFYRRGVLILSLVFAGIIYAAGTTTRFKNVFYTYATILDVSEDYVNDTTYVNIRNPYNRPYTVHLDPSYSVLPITRSRRNGQDSSALWSTDHYQIAIRRQPDELTVEGRNITAFAPRYFQLQKKSLNTEKIGITGEVNYFEGKITGSVTNHFPYPLENAALVLYGNMVYLDRLEAGETKTLDNLEQLRFPLNNSYVVAERITGERSFPETDIGNTRYLLAMKRTNMLMFYLDKYLTVYSADAQVIAFSAEKEESAFLREKTPETYGLTMLTSAIAVNASQDQMLYRSVLMKTPRVVTGQYDAQSNSMSGAEPLTLEYQMGTDIQVESLTFESVSEEFLESGSDHYIEAFTGGIYFYNHSSRSFDRMELEGKTMRMDQLGPYLSPGNILTVRYVYEGTGSYNAIQLPMPMVAGREL